MIAAPHSLGDCDGIVPQSRTLNRRSLHVLVVDDEPLIGALFTEFLHSDGHTAEVADNGATALSKFRKEDFDLVITDQTMAPMNGLDLITEIKKLKPDVPVVLLTGLVDGTRPGKPSAAIDLVLAKPISRNAFCNALAQFAPN